MRTLNKRMLFCGRFRHRALLSSGPSRSECADRSVSQLLAGTPSGPGGSSNAARVPPCDEARRRRTPSRLTTPHDSAPQWTRWAHHKRGSRGGNYAGTTLRTNPLSPCGEGFPPRSSSASRMAGRVRGIVSTRLRRLPLTAPQAARALPQGESGEIVAPLRQATLGTGLRRAWRGSPLSLSPNGISALAGAGTISVGQPLVA